MGGGHIANKCKGPSTTTRGGSGNRQAPACRHYLGRSPAPRHHLGRVTLELLVRREPGDEQRGLRVLGLRQHLFGSLEYDLTKQSRP